MVEKFSIEYPLQQTWLNLRLSLWICSRSTSFRRGEGVQDGMIGKVPLAPLNHYRFWQEDPSEANILPLTYREGSGSVTDRGRFRIQLTLLSLILFSRFVCTKGVIMLTDLWNTPECSPRYSFWLTLIEEVRCSGRRPTVPPNPNGKQDRRLCEILRQEEITS